MELNIQNCESNLKTKKICCRCGVNKIRKRHSRLCFTCYKDLSNHLIETKKIITLQCYSCGLYFNKQQSLIDKRSKAFYCSRVCYRSSRHGSNNANWKGGIKPLTKQIRDSEKMKQWVSDVLRKDNYKCFYCGKGGKLHAHHIINFSAILDSYKFYHKKLEYDGLMNYECLWDVCNGVALCKNCHDKFPKRLPAETINIPPELINRVKQNMNCFVARSVEDVIEGLGLQKMMLF